MSSYPPPDLLFALADDVFDAAPEFLVDLLTEAAAQRREVAEFNFNTTDLTVDLVGRSAVISDVLDASAAAVELSIEALLAPFELARTLPPRCTTYLRQQFGATWKEAMVWLAGLPHTNQNLERIVTAAIVQSRGDIGELVHAVDLGRVDWRDLLMNGGLGPEDWPHVLDKLLGQNNKSRRR